VPIVPDLRRPEPPPDLTETEARAWRSITASKPATWFHGAESILARLCTKIAICEALERRLRLMWEGSGRIDDKLLAMHRQEALAVAKLSQALRLSPGSRYTPRAATQYLNEAKVSRPWEIRAR
jgi:hypothetical protein